MKAVRIHEFGGPEVLRYEGVPAPQLRKNQVLVGVRACAIALCDANETRAKAAAELL